MDPNAPEEPPLEPQPPESKPPEEPSYEAYQELAPEPQPTYQEPAQPPVPDPGAGAYQDPVVQETPPPPPEISTEAPAQSRRRRPATKKRGRGPRPTAKRGGKPTSRPGYQGRSSRRAPAPVHGDGISLFSVFLVLLAIAMLVVVGLIIAPKDLDFIKGYSAANDLIKTNPRNLLSEGQKIMLDRSGDDLVLTEEDVNAYLNHRLQGSQKGVMASLIQYKGCYVDFTPGNAEFFVERSIFGFPLTMSTRIHLKRVREQVRWELIGGSIGKIPLGAYQPQPVVDVFKRIRKIFEDEHQVLNQMVNIKFEEDKVVLDASY